MPDNVQKYLEDAGFNLVALPRANLKPLQLFAREGGSLGYVGHIDDLFKPGDRPKPEVEADIDIPDELRGNNGKTLKSKGSFKFLEKVLVAVGLKGGGVDVSLERQKNLGYEFLDPTLDEVGKIRLDAYLNNASLLDDNSNYAAELRNNNLYITTRTMKSGGIVITNAGDLNVDAALALPNVNNIVSADLQFKHGNTKALEIRYKGNAKLVFALQTMRIFYNKDNKTFSMKDATHEAVRNDGYGQFYPNESAVDIGIL